MFATENESPLQAPEMPVAVELSLKTCGLTEADGQSPAPLTWQLGTRVMPVTAIGPLVSRGPVDEFVSVRSDASPVWPTVTESSVDGMSGDGLTTSPAQADDAPDRTASPTVNATSHEMIQVLDLSARATLPT
jgi:hypothetical protein